MNILKYSRRKINYCGSHIYIYRERKTNKLYFRSMAGTLTPMRDPETGLHLTREAMLRKGLEI